MIGGVAADDGDAGRVLARLMIGRPIHGAALQEAEAHAVTLHDHRRPRRGEVLAGAGVEHAVFVEPRDRGEDVGFAVMHVVGDADGADAGGPERLTGARVGEEPFVAHGVPGRNDETAFEIAEHHVGAAELIGDPGEGNAGVGDVHQVDVAGENHFRRHFGSVPYSRRAQLRSDSRAAKSLCQAPS